MCSVACRNQQRPGSLFNRHALELGNLDQGGDKCFQRRAIKGSLADHGKPVGYTPPLEVNKLNASMVILARIVTMDHTYIGHNAKMPAIVQLNGWKVGEVIMPLHYTGTHRLTRIIDEFTHNRFVLIERQRRVFV